MNKKQRILTLTGAFVGAALVAACGGGGGGAMNPPGGGGGNPSPSPSPSPAASAELTGTLNVVTGGGGIASASYGPAGNTKVVFLCGCGTPVPQAGESTTDGSGNFTILPMSSATPASPSPTYTTVPGRNYLLVAKSAAGAEAWTMEFLGSIPAHNHYLNNTNVSDAYTAAAALYVYDFSPAGVDAYDFWDFTTIAAFVAHLQSSPNASETTLLNDIVTESAANHTLFPANAPWSPSGTTNPKIATDLTNVHNSGDASLPHNCGMSPCGAEPTP